MKTALLIVDVQNDYFPNGKMELYESEKACLKIKELLEDCRDKSIPIIHIQHISVRPGSVFFLPDTSGVEIHNNVKPKAGEKIFIKNFPNSFRNTNLDNYLKENGITKLIITGMMTHICIDTTVRAAFDLGYECIVVGDCCATKSLSFQNNIVSAENMQNAFLAALNGIFAKVIKKEEISDLF